MPGSAMSFTVCFGMVQAWSRGGVSMTLHGNPFEPLEYFHPICSYVCAVPLAPKFGTVSWCCYMWWNKSSLCFSVPEPLGSTLVVSYPEVLVDEVHYLPLEKMPSLSWGSNWTHQYSLLLRRLVPDGCRRVDSLWRRNSYLSFPHG